MANRMAIDDLEKHGAPTQSSNGSQQGKQGQQNGATEPPDMRTEVPPGDPDKEGASHTKTEMEQIEIATPTSRLLLQIEDHFPMDPWPDKLIIDEIKVSFVYNRPLSSGHVVSVLVKDITDVGAESNPLYSALKVVSQDHPEEPKPGSSKGPLMMKFLNKKEASAAKRLIFGLMIMHDRKVDTSKMSVEELKKRADELGRVRKDEPSKEDDDGGEGGSDE